MKYRTLGKSGIEVSEIGFGMWGLGGNSYGPTNDSESMNALELAISNGVNFFDVADTYGNGHSEILLGKAVSGMRDQVVISTKGGYLSQNEKEGKQDFSEAYLESALENSLNRLNTGYIDIYHLHSPNLSEIDLFSLLKILEKFKTNKLIREYAISVRSPECGRIAIEEFGFQIVQVNFSLLDQRALIDGLFSLALDRHVGLIIRTPLTFGYLTGAEYLGERNSDQDHRSNWSLSQRRRWIKGASYFDFVAHGRTKAQAGLRFCLDFRAVSTVIPGMLNVHEVAENLEASNIQSLSQEEHARIRDMYDKNDFYDPSASNK